MTKVSEQQPERDELETQLRNFYTLLGGARDAPDRTSLVSLTYFAHARTYTIEPQDSHVRGTE